MADAAGQWHALSCCYGRHRRPVARSNLLLWPKLQAHLPLALRGSEGPGRRTFLLELPVPLAPASDPCATRPVAARVLFFSDIIPFQSRKTEHKLPCPGLARTHMPWILARAHMPENRERDLSAIRKNNNNKMPQRPKGQSGTD